MNIQDLNLYMNKTIRFAKETNPIWPFAALLVDDAGNPLCIATDCAHISPLYHAESLVIHAWIGAAVLKTHENLTLFSTAEPDALSASAIYWAKVTHDIDITHVCYGSSLATIGKLWPFGIDISAQEIANRSRQNHIRFSPTICEKECDKLFSEAKEKQQGKHPALGRLSNEVKDFYHVYLQAATPMAESAVP